MANKKPMIILILIFINIFSIITLANGKDKNDLNYEWVYSNIKNKQFLKKYPHHITDFAYNNYMNYDIKKDFNKINKVMKCLTAIYNNNPNWQDIISKINYYREMAILSNIISKKASIPYHKKFLYIIYKAEDSLIAGKLKIKNLAGEINTYRYTAIKIITEKESISKLDDKMLTIIELQKKSDSLKAKLFADPELINTKDINDLL